MRILLVVILFLGLTSFCGYAESGCTKYLDKVHKIQQKQRAGHSAKQSNILNKQETKARKKWWECSKSAKQKTVKKTRSKKKKSHKAATNKK
jgi:hypothetical protein